MRLRDRAIKLIQSLVLPVLAIASLVFFTFATVTLATNDRAIVWGEGTPQQLDAMAERVATNPLFAYGRSEPASQARPLPGKCDISAREFSFGSLGEFENQVAQDVLGQLAAEANVTLCLSNAFVINELPDPSQQTALQAAASTVLNASLLPCAFVILVMGLFSQRLLLPVTGINAIQDGSTYLWPVVAALSVMAIHATFSWVGDTADTGTGLSLSTVGYSLAFSMIVAIPIIEETAFRGWMLPLAERAVGTVPATGLSALTYAVANIPQSTVDAAAYFCIGLVYSGLYVRTRSLLICMAANIAASALHFWIY